jgi:hypothetical protein
VTRPRCCRRAARDRSGHRQGRWREADIAPADELCRQEWVAHQPRASRVVVDRKRCRVDCFPTKERQRESQFGGSLRVARRESGVCSVSRIGSSLSWARHHRGRGDTVAARHQCVGIGETRRLAISIRRLMDLRGMYSDAHNPIAWRWTKCIGFQLVGITLPAHQSARTRTTRRTPARTIRRISRPFVAPYSPCHGIASGASFDTQVTCLRMAGAGALSIGTYA